MVFFRTLPALLFAAVLLVSCTGNRLTGTTDETVVTAHVYNPDHSPAVNATVKAFTVNDTSRIPAFQTATDNTGKYTLNVGNGMYNVLVGKDSLGAFQDSVIVKTTYSTLTDDTLTKPVVLCGLLVMQPMHDPRTAIVQILGTDKYANMSANGSFIIGGLPPGNYALRSVTTVAEYTTTYTWLTVPPLAQDTVRDTIELIYTGIPAVKSISAIYDTLRGIVHLSWDTTDYFLLKDYLVYRDIAPVLTPSTQPIGNSTVCRYDDTLASTLGQYQIGLDYRVAVRAKNLQIGETFTDVQLTVVEPFRVYPPKDTTISLGVPFTLRAKVSGYTGSHVSYAWDIGNKGVFVPSASPETTFTLHDTITQDYECGIKVLVDNKTYALDTARLSTQVGWQKVAEAFADSSSPILGLSTVVLGTKMVAFGEMHFSDSAHPVSVWQSGDGQNWIKVTDSIPIPNAAYPTKPVVFLNRICLVDEAGYLWTSTDAATWVKASGAPLCNTVEQGAGFTPPDGSKCPPALFVDGSQILVQPFLGTGSQKILSSTDLVSWDSSSAYQMRSFVSDYVQNGGTLAVTGFDWSNLQVWICLKTSSGLSYSPLPPNLSPPGSGAFAYCFQAYRSSIVFSVQGNSPLEYLTTSPGQQWYACSQIPGARVSALAMFNNTLYLVSTAGVYKAVN